MDRSDLNIVASSRPVPPIKAHLVGNDGPGMVGLARWLVHEGYDVSGNHVRPERGVGAVARVDQGHWPASVPRAMRWLVYSPEVPREHDDRLSALRDGVAETSYPSVLRGLLQQGTGIAVAGRKQGKVAAAMIGWVLAHADLDPTLLLRSDAAQLGGPARSGKGRHTVVDVTDALDDDLISDPGPSVALLMDVEPLCDRRLDLVVRLAASVGSSGYVLTSGGPSSVGRAKGCVESFSLERGSAWWGADLREDRGRYRFRAFHHGRFVAEIRLQVPGRAGVINALAALAICERMEVPIRTIKQALEDFAGVSRTFESRGSYRGVTLVDDDSIEAIDVAAALELARALHGRRRVWTVFSPGGPPHQETISALSTADRLTLLEGAVDAGDWAGMLEGAGVAAHCVESLDEALSDLDKHLEPGDVLLTIGAGEVGTIADAFIRRLPRNRQGR